MKHWYELDWLVPVRDLILVAGGVSVITGISMINIPAAFIVGGIGFITLAYLMRNTKIESAGVVPNPVPGPKIDKKQVQEQVEELMVGARFAEQQAEAAHERQKKRQFIIHEDMTNAEQPTGTGD